MLFRFLNIIFKNINLYLKGKFTMNINFIEKTITLTKIEANKAGKPNSDIYNQLVDMKKSFPEYRIIVDNSTKRKDSLKGLNYQYMEKYIKSHDNAEEIMAEYRTLRGLDNQDSLNVSATYGQIKKWFLATYPEIEEYQNKIDTLINKAS